MGEGSQDRHEQVLTCPDCAGPLHVEQDGAFECEVGHHYELEAAVSAQTAQTTLALMRAVSSLRDRAAMWRWAAAHPEMYPGRDLAQLQEAARLDDEMAEVLVRHARTIAPGTGAQVHSG